MLKRWHGCGDNLFSSIRSCSSGTHSTCRTFSTWDQDRGFLLRRKKIDKTFQKGQIFSTSWDQEAKEEIENILGFRTKTGTSWWWWGICTRGSFYCPPASYYIPKTTKKVPLKTVLLERSQYRYWKNIKHDTSCFTPRPFLGKRAPIKNSPYTKVPIQKFPIIKYKKNNKKGYNMVVSPRFLLLLHSQDNSCPPKSPHRHPRIFSIRVLE